MAARACSTAFRSIGPPSASLTRPFTSPSDSFSNAAHRPLLEDRPLLDPERQDQAVAGGALLDHDVVELPGPEQRRDGALDVAVVDGLVDDEPGGADDLRGGEPPHCPRRRCYRRWAASGPGRRAPPAPPAGGPRRRRWRGVAASALGGGGRAGPDGPALGGPRPGCRSAPGTPAAHRRARRPLRSRRRGRNRP